jgi:hypothetical protein
VNDSQSARQLKLGPVVVSLVNDTKLHKVIVPILVLIVVVLLAAIWRAHWAAWVAVFPVAWMSALVAAAMFEKEKDDETVRKKVGLEVCQGVEIAATPEWAKSLYEKAIQMHIDTDKGMYQLITVFVGASVLVMGWVVASPIGVRPNQVQVIGSMAVFLVGTATLLKHRLRAYNKLREIYLRYLEDQLGGKSGDVPGGTSKQHPLGLHTFMRDALKQGGSSEAKGEREWLKLSFHEVMDLYYFIYLILWIIVYVALPSATLQTP